MHVSKLALLAVPALACLVSLSTAFDPLTLTVGGTAYVLTGTQVALAVAGVAGLAIAKEKLLIAALSRSASRRGRRAAEDISAKIDSDFAPLFQAVAVNDFSNCGKMFVCYVASLEEKTAEQQRIADLFPVGEPVDASEAHASFQVAAKFGREGGAELCANQYASCPVGFDYLMAILDTYNGQVPQISV